LKIVPVNRLKAATPLQVMLQVKISEVSRTVIRDIGVNLLAGGGDGGFNFGIGQGNGIDAGTGSVTIPAAGAALRFAGNVLGVDFISRLQLAETNGLSTTLAEPSLSALSGETASFLAGGEFPIPIASGLSGTSIEFKEYGVSLAFTPTVLEGGRISMRVRPEVSELSSEGAIRVGGVQVPSLTTRRAETTVELGSGQSFMIAGLLRNSNSNSIDKAPFLGDLPIIGALFRSNSFKRNETELVIVVTPYLVRPVNAGQIALPTDGSRTSTTLERVLLDKQESNRSGMPRPQPTLAQPRAVGPGLSSQGSLPAQPGAAPKRQAAQQTTAAPGFSF
jgi:pilus assembly protein CpaC